MRGDPRRARTPLSELDREIASKTIRRLGDEGALSSRQVADRLELVFRAKMLADLDSLMSAVDAPKHVVADVVKDYGIAGAATRPYRGRPWWWWPVVVACGSMGLSVILWLATGGQALWLAVGFVISLVAFVGRLSRYHRSSTGKRSRLV